MEALVYGHRRTTGEYIGIFLKFIFFLRWSAVLASVLCAVAWLHTIVVIDKDYTPPERGNASLILSYRQFKKHSFSRV